MSQVRHTATMEDVAAMRLRLRLRLGPRSARPQTAGTRGRDRKRKPCRATLPTLFLGPVIGCILPSPHQRSFPIVALAPLRDIVGSRNWTPHADAPCVPQMMDPQRPRCAATLAGAHVSRCKTTFPMDTSNLVDSRSIPHSHPQLDTKHNYTYEFLNQSHHFRRARFLYSYVRFRCTAQAW